MTRLGPFLACVLIACGCTCTKPEHRFTVFAFSDSDLASYREMAITAAHSPVTWERFHAKRIGEQPLRLEKSRVEYRFDLERPDLIRLFFDTGEPFGMHSCYVAVTIRRGSEDHVVGIEESFWP